MNSNQALNSWYVVGEYTFFIVYITVLIFVSAIYGFAYKFLNSRFYIPLALGWLASAIYLVVETFLLTNSSDKGNDLGMEFVSAALGFTSTILFNLATLVDSDSIRARRKSISISFVPIIFCLLGAIIGNNSSIYQRGLLFMLLVFPAAGYSSWVILKVSQQFYRIFPEQDYGLNSRFLFGSWGLYAIIQFFYPFKLFGEIQILLFSLFVIAFLVKLVSSIALLNILRESFTAASEELRESSVLADIGNLAAGLHHDIATPLGTIDSELSFLAEARQADEVVLQAIKKIRKPVRLIDSAIKFVDFVRQDPEAIAKGFRKISTRDPIEFSVGLFKKRYPKSSLRIIQPPKNSPIYYIRANKDLLAEAFLNIINNALEASAHVVRIYVRRIRSDDPKVEFSFINDGKLLSKEELRYCFNPGWSSKEKGDNKANIGMGLYMCSRIVKMHRGIVEIMNNENGNEVIVQITLPAARHIADKLSKLEE